MSFGAILNNAINFLANFIIIPMATLIKVLVITGSIKAKLQILEVIAVIVKSESADIDFYKFTYNSHILTAASSFCSICTEFPHFFDRTTVNS